MDPTDVKSHFEDLSGSSFVGNFNIHSSGTDGVRLKGFWHACTTTKRGKITVKDGSSAGAVLLEVVTRGNNSTNSGIVTIPGNGIRAEDGLYVDVSNDGDSSGGLRSITVFYG